MRFMRRSDLLLVLENAFSLELIHVWTRSKFLSELVLFVPEVTNLAIESCYQLFRKTHSQPFGFFRAQSVCLAGRAQQSGP